MDEQNNNYNALAKTLHIKGLLIMTINELNEMLEIIRYPDEPPMAWDSRIDYYDYVEGTKYLISFAKGQDKTDLQKTLSELERRWSEKQTGHKSVSSKKNREVIYPNPKNVKKTSPPI